MRRNDVPVEHMCSSITAACFDVWFSGRSVLGPTILSNVERQGAVRSRALCAGRAFSPTQFRSIELPYSPNLFCYHSEPEIPIPVRLLQAAKSGDDAGLPKFRADVGVLGM